MLSNYFTIAFRQLRKKPLYTSLNIVGLALGVASCLLITLYVAHELAYDRWNPNADRIWRPWADINFGGSHMQMAVSCAEAGPDATKEIPEVQAWCRLRNNGSYLVRQEGEGQQNFKEAEVLYADSTFFEVFPLPVLELLLLVLLLLGLLADSIIDRRTISFCATLVSSKIRSKNASASSSESESPPNAAGDARAI